MNQEAQVENPGYKKSPVLKRSFFARDVHEVSRDLIGCRLDYEGAGGLIVETEAYNRNDPACHAYSGMTARNKVMFGPPGRAYIYFTYGMHHLLNIVCEAEGEPAAVLIRAIEPTEGIDMMRRRRAPVTRLAEFTNGPGKLTRALGIDLEQNGIPVYRGQLKIFARTSDWRQTEIVTSPRIGIRVGTRREWRYCAADSRFLSRKVASKGERR
jgi:DNA-3-methyladenine glycosylase